MWHVKQFQSTKHFDLQHMLQLFPFPSELLFSYFEASVKQYCLRRLQKQAKTIAVNSTAITQKTQAHVPFKVICNYLNNPNI